MMVRKPKPGDLVCARTTDDVLIKKGSCGVIEGKVGSHRKTFYVLFNPSPMPWWTIGKHGGYVSSSGGPERIIKTKNMKDTGKSRNVGFQYWETTKGGYPIMGAGLAKVKERRVNVFNVDL